MKIWLKRYDQRILAVMVGLLSVAIVTIIHFFPPEPESCTLCGEGIPYHAPVLLNLATGEMGELCVYQNDMVHPGELAAEQQDGYMQLIYYDGFTTMVNAGRSCHATLSAEQAAIKPSLYCNECRELLSTVSTKGFVLLDLYVPNNFAIYPVTDGAEYEIRDYTVSVSSDEQSRIHVDVTGHREFR